MCLAQAWLTTGAPVDGARPAVRGHDVHITVEPAGEMVVVAPGPQPGEFLSAGQDVPVATDDGDQDVTHASVVRRDREAFGNELLRHRASQVAVLRWTRHLLSRVPGDPCCCDHLIAETYGRDHAAARPEGAHVCDLSQGGCGVVKIPDVGAHVLDRGTEGLVHEGRCPQGLANGRWAPGLWTGARSDSP